MSLSCSNIFFLWIIQDITNISRSKIPKRIRCSYHLHSIRDSLPTTVGIIWTLSSKSSKILSGIIAAKHLPVLFNSFNSNYCRDLPRAIAISLVTVTLCYVLANVSFYTTLSPHEVLGSASVAVVRFWYGWRCYLLRCWTAIELYFLCYLPSDRHLPIAYTVRWLSSFLFSSPCPRSELSTESYLLLPGIICLPFGFMQPSMSLKDLLIVQYPPK